MHFTLPLSFAQATCLLTGLLAATAAAAATTNDLQRE